MKKSIQTHLSPAKLARLLKQKSPLKIGLTGGIGAGKSSALKAFQERKIPVLQTDLLSHLLLHDRKIKARLVKVFGKDILDADIVIDRKKLAQAAFQSSHGQKKLNAIMHPAVRRGVARWVKQQAQQKPVPRLVVVEVPLLFERGFYRFFDGTLSISAVAKSRQKRLKKRGWSLSEIRRREALQWSQERKNQKADWVIFNQSTEKDLKYVLYNWVAQF
ncbi:MAG TPA: dephospho-CoA kinase [bacterium]|nr:dephospho-CoA kinase [bacterium]